MTPAGRSRYLAILFDHLYMQTASFDEWHLLMNTSDVRDIAYCERLCMSNPWIQTKYARGSDPASANLNIHRFLNEFCRDPDAVYLRLDDDIVFLSESFVATMFDFRLEHPDPFLVYANIINNAVVSWIHQKLGNFRFAVHSGYSAIDDVGLHDPEFAAALHSEFLRSHDDPKWLFDRWLATEYERISINAVSWFGQDLNEPVEADEEHWLSVARPKELSRPNMICGSAVCVHFAFQPQRATLDSCGLLDRYARLGASLKDAGA